ncbi:MAG: hypothetical protein JSR93_03515, partial [Verrucomicrobia bacterium]|nr:hypothetical protein [Verrucomicrobiota bacterium]
RDHRLSSQLKNCLFLLFSEMVLQSQQICRQFPGIDFLSGYLPSATLPFDKTTLYIACKVIEWNPEYRTLNDLKASSTIE